MTVGRLPTGKVDPRDGFCFAHFFSHQNDWLEKSPQMVVEKVPLVGPYQL